MVKCLILFKNIFSKILIFIILISNLCLCKISASSKTYDLNAHAAVVMDAKTNRILFDKNSRKILPMASTTKILTALVAITNEDLNKKFKISSKAASIRGSSVGYKENEEISLKELLFGLMFRSGNDAAIAIAEGVAGSVENFCNLMNEYARKLGLLDSHFESPHGLDSENHYSTAYDLAILTSKAKQFEFFNELSKTKLYRETGFSREYQNINKILYRVPQATGTKTGYTGQAGKCLVSSFNMGNDNEIIVVVLNCTPRWKSSEWLYNFAKDNFEFKKLFSKGDVVINEMIGEDFKVEGFLNTDIIVPVKNGCNATTIIKLNDNIKNCSKEEIENFEYIGTIKVFENDEQIFIAPILNKNYKSM